jgi:serine/threonine-protein kinase RsbW
LPVNDVQETDNSLTLPADIASLRPFQEHVQVCAEAAGLSQTARMHIDLVLEEVLLNVFHYAYPPDYPGQVRLDCFRLPHEQAILVRIQDQGRAFNPLEQPPPDVNLEMDQRQQGGLGILLVRKMTRSLDYHRENDTNVLEMVFG